MAPSWLSELRKHYDFLKECAFKQDQNSETCEKQLPTDVEIDETSEAEINAIVINKPRKSLFDSIQPVASYSPEITYNLARQYAEQYFASCPGRDISATNAGAHGKLDRLLRNPQSTPQEIQACQFILEYRLNAMSVSEQLLLAVGLPQPKCNNKEIPPERFNSDALEAFLRRQENFVAKKWNDILGMVFKAKLFGRPIEEQGRPWDKPQRYIAAGFFFMPGINRDIVRDKLAAMVDICMNNTDPAVMRIIRPEEAFTGFEGVTLVALKKSSSGPEDVLLLSNMY